MVRHPTRRSPNIAGPTRTMVAPSAASGSPVMLVEPMACARLATGPCRALPSHRILSPRLAFWDRSITVIPSFPTRIHPAPACRCERPAHEPPRPPSRRD